jgi:thioredoxin 1
MTVTLTAQNFDSEVLQSSGLVLVDFWAVWCGPCQVLGPIIEEIAEGYKGNNSFKIAKLNVDENTEIAQKYGIMSIPALKFFKNGQVVDELIGLQSKEAIVEKINKLAVD